MSVAQSRRAAIAAVAALALAGGAGLLPALRWLEQTRHRHDILSAQMRAPIPTVQPALAPEAVFHGDRLAAEAALVATVRDLATRERALIERIDRRPAPAIGLVAGHAVLSGDARTMLRLVESIESRTPTVRLPSYRLATTGSGQSLRLEADLVMAFAP